MPFLDVSGLLLDPDLADTFTVLRQAQSISNSGAVSTTTQTMIAMGVVTPTSPDDLIRGDAAQLMPKSITVDTTFPLQGPAPGFDADIVVWRGDNFVVSTIDDYSNFGAGYVHAVCQSVDSINQPPDPIQV